MGGILMVLVVTPQATEASDWDIDGNEFLAILYVIFISSALGYALYACEQVTRQLCFSYCLACYAMIVHTEQNTQPVISTVSLLCCYNVLISASTHIQGRTSRLVRHLSLCSDHFRSSSLPSCSYLFSTRQYPRDRISVGRLYPSVSSCSLRVASWKRQRLKKCWSAQTNTTAVRQVGGMICASRETRRRQEMAFCSSATPNSNDLIIMLAVAIH